MTDHQSDSESLSSFSFAGSPVHEEVFDQLHQLKTDVLRTTETQIGFGMFENTKQHEQVLAAFENMERTLEGLVSSLNTATTAANERAAAAAAENPMQEKLEDDMTSPLRDSLRAKIELVKKIMFALEKNPQKHDAKPVPPGEPVSVDDDLYMIWCASPNTLWYKHKLFEMMESLRSKEEEERRTLRNLKREQEQLNGSISSGTEDSAHRQYLRAKIAAIKRAAFEFYPEKTNGKAKPTLPVDASLIDLDVFLVWCLRSDDYKDCQRKDRYAKCTYRDTSKFEQELGCVIENLQALDEEERRFLTHQKEEKEEEKTPEQAEEEKTPEQAEEEKAPEQAEEEKAPEQAEEAKAPEQVEEAKAPEQVEEAKAPEVEEVKAPE
ncbi:hypothetical protein BGZ58_009256 [Dissophora ornata]|nr:hypothetical protein BGZ58_009256 [Dissophora ornata]